MIRWAALGAIVLAFVMAAIWIVWPRQPVGDVVIAPSGQAVTIHEVLFEEDSGSGMWIVVRVAAPNMEDLTGDQRHADLVWACETWGIPAGEILSRPPERIIVQMMAQTFPRGEPAQGITQNIEAYSLSDASCIWELF